MTLIAEQLSTQGDINIQQIQTNDSSVGGDLIRGKVNNNSGVVAIGKEIIQIVYQGVMPMPLGTAIVFVVILLVIAILPSYTPISRSTSSEVIYPLRLTVNRGVNREPSFSPDGKRIVFVSNRDGHDEIYVMQKDGSRPRRITDAPNVFKTVPTYSSDGSHIIYSGVYAAGSEVRDSELYIVTANSQQIQSPFNLSNKPDSDEGRPRISPSGKLITYDSAKKGDDADIFIAQFTTTGLIEPQPVLIRPEHHDKLPIFTKDETHIIFRSELMGDKMETSKIYSVDRSGTSITQLSTDAAEWYQNLSLSGDFLVYTSDIDGNPEIYVRELSNGRIWRITNNPDWDDFASFSPDGKWILFSSTRDGGDFNIYITPFNQE